MKILYFSPIDWNFIRQRPQQLALELSRQNEVIYFSSRGLRGYLKQWLRKRNGQRVFLSIRSKINEKLILYQPLILPQAPLPIIHRINSSISKIWLKCLVKQRKLDNPVLWLNHPHQADYISLFPNCLICYDCMDNWSEFNLGREKELIEKEEDHILSKADVVFASSQLLLERMKGKCKRVYLIPNACEVEHFAQAVKKDLPIPPELENFKKPRIGYMGIVAEWHDLELIGYAAERRKSYHFVFIGPIGINVDISPYKKIPNLHFLGGRPYEILPNYLQHMDVCILPFRTGDFAQTIDPVKVYEYLAAGRPVVSVDMRELHKLNSVVRIAKNKEDFVNLLDQALEDAKTPKKHIQKCMKIIEDHSWGKRAAKIENLITENLKNPKFSNSHRNA
jgi:glycosyltransferase involved in cell wall biosynthesis